MLTKEKIDALVALARGAGNDGSPVPQWVNDAIQIAHESGGLEATMAGVRDVLRRPAPVAVTATIGKEIADAMMAVAIRLDDLTRRADDNTQQIVGAIESASNMLARTVTSMR